MSRNLTFKEEIRIRRAIENKVQFFSPTISPAPKSLERGEIESIDSAIEMYQSLGVAGVVIQPKYMGSYCDIYLHRDIEKTRFFSRGGHLVRHDNAELLKAVLPLHERIFETAGIDEEIYIIQSELLPWSALGKGLIDRDFGGYKISHTTHLNYLKETDLGGEINKLIDDPKYQMFLIDQGIMDKAELKKKYSEHVVSQYTAMQLLSIPDVNKYEKAVDLYSKQLDIYGAESQLEFKPFNILKVIHKDGSHYIINNHENAFCCVSDDKYFVMYFEDNNINQGVENAYQYFDKIVDHNMEGVVIKPLFHKNTQQDIVPMFKVRNNNYLQMIYGVRFNDEYDYYLDRRSVGKKMRASRNQWNIAQAILNIPINDISKDNGDYVRLIRARIYEEDFEKLLDARL